MEELLLRTCHSYTLKYEKTCWYGNHLEKDVEVSVGLQGHCDADLAVSGFKNGAFTYLVVLLGRILNRREALLCLYAGEK